MKHAFILRCCRWSFCFLVFFTPLHRVTAADLTENLQKGLFEEEANHNLPAAIEQYKAVIVATDEQRKLTATAIYRLAECYRKLGQQKEADELYARLQRDFSEQTQFLPNAKPATADQTIPSSPASLSDFLSSERMATLQPELISSTITQAKLQYVIDAVKGIDSSKLPAVLKAAYPSALYSSAGSEIRILEDKLTLATLLLTMTENNPQVLELKKRIAHEEKSVKSQINNALSQLVSSLSNSLATADRLEAERKQIFSSISPSTAVPLLQNFIRDLLSQKQKLESLIKGLKYFQPPAIDEVSARLRTDLEILNPQNLQKMGPNRPDPKEVARKTAELNEQLQARIELFRQGNEIQIASLHAAIDSLDALLKSAEADYKKATGEAATATASSPQPNPYASLMRLLDNSPDLLNAAYATNSLSYLQNAAASGNVELTKLLLDRGALVDKATPNGMTPLHLAVQKGHKSVAELLLKAGANVNAKTTSDQDRQVPPGSTPLHLAARNGFTALSELLLKNGAATESQDSELKTPLHRAVEQGQLEEMRFLLEHGANIEAQNSWHGTPLVSAVTQNQISAALLLLSSNAQVNISDTFGITPLAYATRNAQRDLITTLLEKGADPNAQDRNGQTALMYAVDKADFLTTELLLKSKASPNLQDKEGRTALHQAVLKRDTRVLELLLNSGADPEIKDNVQQTALDYALGGARIADNSATSQTPEAARILLDHGAKAENKQLWRAIDSPDLLKRLLDAKIDPNTKSHEGRTPLDALKSAAIANLPYGANPTRQQSIQLLEQYGGTNTIFFTNQPSFQQRLQSIVQPPPANTSFERRLNTIVGKAPETNSPTENAEPRK